MPRYESMAERLLANSVVDPGFFPLTNGEPCWLWMGARDRYGYGTLCVRWKRGKRRGQKRTVRAHRESIKAFKHRYMGRRYIGKHACNNPACMNPSHLTGGTVRSNNRQTVRDGRHWSGFRGPKPKEATS